MSSYEKALTIGETREAVAKAINAIDPRRVKTIADAIAMISLADGVNNRFNLAKYRTIYNVHATGIWRQDLRANGKPCETFHAWAKYRFSMEKTNAYNAVKVGGFVREDGAGSVFDTAEAYFNFSQLLEICNAKRLYTNPKTREEFKQVNKIRRAKTDDGHYRSETTFENGKPVTRLLFEIADDNGEKVSIVEALVECGVIDPNMTVKAIRKALSKSYTFDKYGAHEENEIAETDELSETEEDELSETEVDELTETNADELTETEAMESFEDDYAPTMAEAVECAKEAVERAYSNGDNESIPEYFMDAVKALLEWLN